MSDGCTLVCVHRFRPRSSDSPSQSGQSFQGGFYFCHSLYFIALIHASGSRRGRGASGSRRGRGASGSRRGRVRLGAGERGASGSRRGRVRLGAGERGASGSRREGCVWEQEGEGCVWEQEGEGCVWEQEGEGASGSRREGCIWEQEGVGGRGASGREQLQPSSPVDGEWCARGRGSGGKRSVPVQQQGDSSFHIGSRALRVFVNKGTCRNHHMTNEKVNYPLKLWKPLGWAPLRVNSVNRLISPI